MQQVAKNEIIFNEMSGQVCGSFPAEAKQELAGFQQITAKLKVLQQGCSVLSF